MVGGAFSAIADGEVGSERKQRRKRSQVSSWKFSRIILIQRRHVKWFDKLLEGCKSYVEDGRNAGLVGKGVTKVE